MTGTGDIGSVDELRTRLVDYVKLQWTRGYPSKLRTLNVRFGIKASSLGVTVRDLVNELVELSPAFEMHIEGRSVILFPIGMRERMLADCDGEMEMFDKVFAHTVKLAQ